jgi:hypothetical protein
MDVNSTLSPSTLTERDSVSISIPSKLSFPGLDARNEFARLERLADVVVCAELQARHAIDDVATSRQHDDRDVARLSHLAADCEAVFAGQHHIEKQQVRVFHGQLAEALVRVSCGYQLDAKTLEEFPQKFGMFAVVIDDKDFGHARIIARRTGLVLWLRPIPSRTGSHSPSTFSTA